MPMDIDTSLEISKGLVYRNNPLLIVILDSKNTATENRVHARCEET